MSFRKPLAALAVLAAAAAFAIPAATAGAATPKAAVDPTVCQLLNFTEGPFGPTAFIGGGSLATVLAGAGNSVGCVAASPAAGPQGLALPIAPFF
jgi:hypothetical protein